MPSDTYRGGGGGGGIISHYFPFAILYIKQPSYDSFGPATLYLTQGRFIFPSCCPVGICVEIRGRSILLMLSYRTPLKDLYISYLVPLCRVRLIHSLMGPWWTSERIGGCQMIDKFCLLVWKAPLALGERILAYISEYIYVATPKIERTKENANRGI